MKLTSTFMVATLVVLLTSCKKDDLKPPTADAGPSQTIQLPIAENQVTVTGSGTSSNGAIKAYLWSLVSGPNIPSINAPSSTTAILNDLVAGTYILQFTVTDEAGLTGADTLSLTVNAPVQRTITIQPANNANETHVDSYNIIGGAGDVELEIGTWTINGTVTSWRSFVKFDQSQVPSNATILSATLYLSSTPNPIAGNLKDAQYGPANAFYVERITANWNPAAFTWATHPTSTSLNRVSVPQSASTTENCTIDVTTLVRDMQTNGNFGFAFRLQNESIYNMRQYASSFHSNAALHPKLVITYR